MKRIIIQIGLILFMILYAAFPDLAPGPIDDIIVVLAGFIASAKIWKKKNRKDDE